MLNKVLTPTPQNVTSFRKRVIAIGYNEIMLSRVDTSPIKLVSLVKEEKWVHTYTDKLHVKMKAEIKLMLLYANNAQDCHQTTRSKVRGMAEILSYQALEGTSSVNTLNLDLENGGKVNCSCFRHSVGGTLS